MKGAMKEKQGRREKDVVVVIGQESEVSLVGATELTPTADDRPGWKPAFLRPWALAAILGFVVAQMVGLVVLYAVSARNNGILPVAEDFHSLWKYGPTAVLTVAVAVWLQVEYRTKQFVPWSALMSGSSSPDRRRDALATDYFSPWGPKVLVASVRRRHGPVAAAIVATWLLQLAVIFSTGLLERRQQPTTLWVDNVATVGRLTSDTDWAWSAQKDNDLFNALVVANSSLSGENLDLPPGTTQNLVYQPVVVPTKEVQNVQTNATAVRSFTATVKYVQPDISCRPLHERLNFSIPIALGRKTYTLSSGGFSLSVSADYSDMRWPANATEARMVADLNLTTTLPSGGGQQRTVPFQTPVKEADQTCEAETRVFQFGCGGISPNSTGGTATIPWGPFGGRTDCTPGVWVLSTWECRDANHTVSNFSSTLMECAPANRWGDATLRFDDAAATGEPTVLQLRDRSNDTAAAGPQPGRNLPELVFYIAVNAVFSSGTSGLLVPALRWLDGRHPDEYLDFARVYASVKQRYPAFASQVYAVRYVAPESGLTAGSVEILTERLSVQLLAFALLMGMLGSVALIAIYLMVAFRRPSPVPADPASMVGTVVVLSQAARPAELFDTCRTFDEFWAQRQQRRRRIVFSRRKAAPSPWWRPWGATMRSRWLTVALVAAMIIAVEVSYRVSQRNEGIATANVMSLSMYLWTYIPAVIINALAILILAIEFNHRVFQPYARLSRGGRAASDALFENHVFGLLPARLWRLARSRNRSATAALAFVTAATVFASLSSIVIGDLFTFSGLPGTHPDFPLLQLDGFDAARPYNWSAGPDGGSPDLGTNSSFYGFNLLRPAPFTTDAYALARLALKEAMADDAGAFNRTVTVIVPATRGRLNCTVLEPQQTRCSESTASFGGAPALPCTNWDISVAPEYRGEQCTLPSSRPMQFFSTRIGQYRTCWKDPAAFAGRDAPIDQCTDIDEYHQTCYYGRRDPYLGLVSGWFDPYNEPQRAPGCAAVVAWGRLDFASCAGAKLTFAACSPYVELVHVEATLSLPSLSIRSVQEVLLSPRTPENTAKKMSIFAPEAVLPAWSTAAFGPRQSNASSVLYPPGSGIAKGQQDSLSSPLEALTTIPETPANIDPAAQANLADGPHVTLQEFVGTDDASRKKVLDGLDALWATTMARLADDALRTDSGGGSSSNATTAPPVTISGVLADYAERRVVQDLQSTRLLQGLYGGVLACLLIGFFFPFHHWTSNNNNKNTAPSTAEATPMAKMLPFPPTSIAATVKLLAESGALPGFVGREEGITMPAGLERWGEKEMNERDTFGVRDRAEGVTWWKGDGVEELGGGGLRDGEGEGGKLERGAWAKKGGSN